MRLSVVDVLRSTSGDARRILVARGLRAFADGFVALLLPIYLVDLGFSSLAIGSIVASTLIGTALLTLWVGWVAHRHSRRTLLLAAAGLMAATGLGFATLRAFWPLLVIAFVGTMNPTSGDASVFLPLEQTVLTQTVEARQRTALFRALQRHRFARQALSAFLRHPCPIFCVDWTGTSRGAAIQYMFALYALLERSHSCCTAHCLPRSRQRDDVPTAPLQHSRRLVYGLAALFGMDSFGTGFLVQSLLALWLYQTFHISVAAAAAILFWSSVCSAVSYLVAVPIAERIGLINTMVFTHLPSNMLLVLVPFAPDLPTAIGLLLARSALSQMDVPTRSFVRHGRGTAGGAAGGCERHGGAQDIRLGCRFVDLGLPADAVELRLAAADRRCDQGHL